MKANKTSTSTSETAEKPVVLKPEPVKRTKKSSTATEPSTPKAPSHKHSKLAVPPVTTAVPAKELDHEAVARLAHSFWVEREYVHGFADEDWHRAVKVLSASA